jgi:hypothetical protein
MPRYEDDDDDRRYRDDDNDEPRRRPRPKKKFKKKPSSSGDLPMGVKVGIFVGVLGVLLVLALVFGINFNRRGTTPGNNEVVAGPIAGRGNAGMKRENTNSTVANPAPQPAPVKILFNLSNLRRGRDPNFMRPTLSVDYEFVGETGFSGTGYCMCVRKGQDVSRVNLGLRAGSRDTMTIENRFGGTIDDAFSGHLEVWFEEGSGYGGGGKRVSEVLALN